MFIKKEIINFKYINSLLGIGDWGLGIGDWAQSPSPLVIKNRKLII